MEHRVPYLRKSQRDRKGNFKKGGKIFRSPFGNKTSDGFVPGTLSLNGNALNVDELQCHRVKIDVGFDWFWKDLGDIGMVIWFNSKTIPEGRFIGIPIVCFKHRRIGNRFFDTRSVLENTNYIYQDNETSASILSVIKKIKPLQKSWLQLSRTTEPQARQHRTTFNFEGGNGAIVSASGKTITITPKFKP
jgi:hypothetical protein